MDNEASSIHSWFDKLGIISNIRTQLRHNFVTALKNHDLASNLKTTPKFAKQYIYDLLVAEYLWSHNYSYTLSIFISEAPLLIDFFSFLHSNTSDKNKCEKFQSDYIHHILESLGVDPKNSKGQRIIEEYTKKDIPLLLCILNFTKNLICNNESLVDNKDKNMHEEIEKINNAKRKLLQQKELFNAHLKQKETRIKDQALLIEKQMVDLEIKLDHAQKMIHSYNDKEIRFVESKRQENLRLEQKERELIKKEKILSRETEKLQQERNNYQQFEGDLRKLQDELLKAKKEFSHSKNNNFSVKDISVQTDFESFILSQTERSVLSQERNDLNNLVKEQQTRIEQLTNKVVLMSRKLEEKQILRVPGLGISTPLIKYINTTSVISESSSTEDILQDARLRLRRLEEESLKADQYYQNYINNSLR